MHVYCSKCRTQQKGSEKYCTKCGAKYGEALWVLILGVLLAIFFPVIMTLNGIDWHEPQSQKVITLLELPILCVTAFLYDYNPIRRSIYFWGGGILIVGLVFYFNR